MEIFQRRHQCRKHEYPFADRGVLVTDDRPIVLVPEIDTDVDVATAARFEYLGKNEEELAYGSVRWPARERIRFLDSFCLSKHALRPKSVSLDKSVQIAFRESPVQPVDSRIGYPARSGQGAHLDF